MPGIMLRAFYELSNSILIISMGGRGSYYPNIPDEKLRCKEITPGPMARN